MCTVETMILKVCLMRYCTLQNGRGAVSECLLLILISCRNATLRELIFFDDLVILLPCYRVVASELFASFLIVGYLLSWLVSRLHQHLSTRVCLLRLHPKPCALSFQLPSPFSLLSADCSPLALLRLTHDLMLYHIALEGIERATALLTVYTWVSGSDNCRCNVDLRQMVNVSDAMILLSTL